MTSRKAKCAKGHVLSILTMSPHWNLSIIQMRWDSGFTSKKSSTECAIERLCTWTSDLPVLGITDMLIISPFREIFHHNQSYVFLTDFTVSSYSTLRATSSWKYSNVNTVCFLTRRGIYGVSTDCASSLCCIFLKSHSLRDFIRTSVYHFLNNNNTEIITS